MNNFVVRALIVCGLGLAAPALGGVNGFAIVNQTGAVLHNLEIRRVGEREWRPLAVSPAPGASARAAFTDPNCAFDLRATIAAAGQIVWSGVNLCDVKRVTLNRDSSGRHWVDYD